MSTCRPVFLIATMFLLPACSGDGLEPAHWSVADVRLTLEQSLGSPFIVRFQTPIAVNTNGIPRAELALRRFEEWTGGLVTFTRVNTNPTNGLVFVEGNSVNGDGSPGCGNVTDVPPPAPGVNLNRRTIGGTVLIGLYTIHLGSTKCDDRFEGHYESAVAEHELGHAIGLNAHFVGFRGNEGFSDPLMFAVVVTLYANTPGTPMATARVLGQ